MKQLSSTAGKKNEGFSTAYKASISVDGKKSGQLGSIAQPESLLNKKKDAQIRADTKERCFDKKKDNRQRFEAETGISTWEMNKTGPEKGPKRQLSTDSPFFTYSARRRPSLMASSSRSPALALKAL